MIDSGAKIDFYKCQTKENITIQGKIIKISLFFSVMHI
jgi:hypothetical protein